ncbi:MAG: enoyl-CoA hydratase/isomerase family protein [Sphingomonadales bacterium]|nr:enoyl-CoA hydratase/isomerase family protein [Sphingomonadales bacterium]
MPQAIPQLTQFRVEARDNGLIHLVFDCPGKSMNVFSNTAIHELGTFAEWLHRSDVRGVVVRSGKDTGFCAGADLTELGVAYEMIIAAPPADRFDMAFDHFFPLSHAIRRLETSGKPVAAAIHGVALGGGCELTLGCHYRVATNSRRTVLGLPECAVGLLPGAGGTQRMPRLVGIDLGLEILLLGRNLQGQAARDAGLVDELAEEGAEVAAAEAWLLSGDAHSIQPWDRADAVPLDHAACSAPLTAHRARELARMLGHEPAPLAILDCVELGLMQPIDGAIRSEMSVFSALIQRPEPRNMIRTMFLGKQAWDKAERAGKIPPEVEAAAAAILQCSAAAVASCPQLRCAGFSADGKQAEPVQQRAGRDYWFLSQPRIKARIAALAQETSRLIEPLSDVARLQLDHACVRNGALPAYLGGATGIVELASS